ncbi:fucolectin-like [Aplysia californica]|uniref:Fucolectin-like n=1 Tax=Aplysia californica TaxID=6500 RepID=A0ABM0JUW6_APLCA|nr:fucolectin-like [Aplysia californica]
MTWKPICFNKVHVTGILVFCFLSCVLSVNNRVNVALNKPAEQSGLLENAKFPNGSAFRAVDGDKDPEYKHGSCAHTTLKGAQKVPAWWMVDLQKQFQVHAINISNRNVYSERMQNFSVYVKRDNPMSDSEFPKESRLGELCLHRQLVIAASTTELLSCSSPVTGRYVTVYKFGFGPLVMCELEVLAEAAAEAGENRPAGMHYLNIKRRMKSLQSPFIFKSGLRSLLDCAATCSKEKEQRAFTGFTIS